MIGGFFISAAHLGIDNLAPCILAQLRRAIDLAPKDRPGKDLLLGSTGLHAHCHHRSLDAGTGQIGSVKLVP